MKLISIISLKVFTLLVKAEASLSGNEIIFRIIIMPMILLDGKEIRQVLLNVVSNAFQSMQHGQVIILLLRKYAVVGDQRSGDKYT